VLATYQILSFSDSCAFNQTTRICDFGQPRPKTGHLKNECLTNNNKIFPGGNVASIRAFPDPAVDLPRADTPGTQKAVLAGGCFWCVEAVYRQLEGIRSVVSGYAGGTADTANYRAVCSGSTNHAEAVQVEFDASELTFGQLLKVFFSVAHDPTQLHRQGNDVGRQYRSAIFYADDAQKRVAESYIRQIDDAHILPSRIVTTLEPLEAFHPAEDYHQDYAARNPDQPYIACIAMPKVEKVRQHFPERLKTK
jgi:peptide-methionine (S)-S-oxide reductase